MKRKILRHHQSSLTEFKAEIKNKLVPSTACLHLFLDGSISKRKLRRMASLGLASIQDLLNVLEDYQ